MRNLFLMEQDTFLRENGNNPFASFLKEAGAKPSKSGEKLSPDEQTTPFSSTLLIELVQRIKNTLTSIKNFTFLSIDKFNDPEFRKYSLNHVNEDIKKIDSVLNTLLNYISINTPIIKSNTLPLILEGVLETNERQIEDKRIKIFKRLEKDLPETSLHDEQVRFILHSVLQYAILSSPLNGTIGFLVKSFDFQKEAAENKVPFENSGGYIEVAVGFVGGKKPGGEEVSGLEISAAQKEKPIDLILQLVKEIIQRNSGAMTFQVDQKKARTLISLKFPVERRKVIYYEPITV